MIRNIGLQKLVSSSRKDSPLDARYEIAQDTLWGTYSHPLSELSDSA
jgi:hypothetical protein